MDFLVIIIGLVVITVLLFVTIKVAPFGSEDKDGFHYSKSYKL